MGHEVELSTEAIAWLHRRMKWAKRDGKKLKQKYVDDPSPKAKAKVERGKRDIRLADEVRVALEAAYKSNKANTGSTEQQSSNDLTPPS